MFVLGEDVAHGGAYGATHGLLDRFGRERVRDTPISEAAPMPAPEEALEDVYAGAVEEGWS